MARPRILQWLLFIYLLPPLSSELIVTRVSAIQFQYSAASNVSSQQQFKLVWLSDPSYGGTKAAYGADGAVWLTPNPQDRAKYIETKNVGRFIFNQPVQFAHGADNTFASFSTSFEFQIVCVPDANGHCADGMAFFIASQAAVPANVANVTSGFLGLTDNSSTSPHFFAVEFDTFQNSELEDPSFSHIGIDFNSLISNVTTNTAANYSPLYLYNNFTFLAWVEYNASSYQIQVWMTNDTTSKERPPQTILETECDLSTIFNESNLYVGFSAFSGESYEGHALYAWNFSTTVSPYHCKHCTRKLLLPLLLSFSALAALLAALYIAFIVIRKHKARLADRHKRQAGIYSSVPRYSYSDLKRATKGFSDKQVVGQGAFSRVYKGILQVNGSNAVVAVKRLNEGLGEEAALPSEVKIISSIRHRNLLQLYGWCYHKGKALLVYQYMPNGSLDQHLYGERLEAGLSSETRYNILLGVAAALEYLHTGLGECVLHRDVKAANVLLSEDFQPLLGDFGLARFISHNKLVTMTAAGTPGYLAPEVFFSGRATDKADVYSFGALALEVACGRRVLDYLQQPQEMNLIEWAWLLQQSNKLLDALDPKMQLADAVTPETNEMRDATATPITNDIADEHYRWWTCVLHLGLVCCHPLPDCRPTMRQVHQVLKDTIILPLPTTRPDFPYSCTRSKRPATPLLFPLASISTGSSSSRSVVPTPTSSKSSFKQVEMQPVSLDKKSQPA